MNPPGSRSTWRRVLPLAAGVLGVHVVLLAWQPRLVQTPSMAPTRSLVIRSIPAQAPVVAEPAIQTAPPAVAAAPRPPAPARTRAIPTPDAAPAPSPPPPSEPPVAESPAGPAPDAQGAAPPPGPVATVPAQVRPPASMRGLDVQVLAIPEPSRIRYEVTIEARGLVVQGQAQLLWRHDGKDYEAQLEVDGPMLPRRMQRSTGRITEEGLAPSRFLDKSRTEQATHFERDKGKLTFSNNRPEAELVAGTQDRLSVVIQLSVLIGGEPHRFPPGTQIGIPTAGVRDAETWVFTVEGPEDLQLPGGPVQAIKLQRLPRKEFDQKVELWLAPRMDYAPVRLRLTSPNGDSVDQRWSSTDRG
jgi:hypothetical protein